MRVPAGLDWWRGEPGGAAWLEALPSLVSACAERWELTPADPFEPARISLVVPATLRSGEQAVLKLNFPEPESERLAEWLGAEYQPFGAHSHYGLVIGEESFEQVAETVRLFLEHHRL